MGGVTTVWSAATQEPPAPSERRVLVRHAGPPRRPGGRYRGRRSLPRRRCPIGACAHPTVASGGPWPTASKARSRLPCLRTSGASRAFLLALEQVVLVLNLDEGRPTVELCSVLELGELP